MLEEEDGNLEPQDSDKPATEGKPSGKRPKSPAQVELEKLGTQFSYEEGSERHFYTFNWLRPAYELEPKEVRRAEFFRKGGSNCLNLTCVEVVLFSGVLSRVA